MGGAAVYDVIIGLLHRGPKYDNHMRLST